MENFTKIYNMQTKITKFSPCLFFSQFGQTEAAPLLLLEKQR